MKIKFIFAALFILGGSIVAGAQTSSLIYACVTQSGQPAKLSAVPITCQQSQTIITWPSAIPKKLQVIDANNVIYGDVFGLGTFVVPTAVSGDPSVPVIIHYTVAGLVDGSAEQYWFDTSNCSGPTYLPLGASGEHFGVYYPPLQQVTYPRAAISLRSLHSHRSVSSEVCQISDATLYVGENLGFTLLLPAAPLVVGFSQ